MALLAFSLWSWLTAPEFYGLEHVPADRPVLLAVERKSASPMTKRLDDPRGTLNARVFAALSAQRSRTMHTAGTPLGA